MSYIFRIISNATCGKARKTRGQEKKEIADNDLSRYCLYSLMDRRATTGAWRSKSSLPGEHGRPCCLHVSRRACVADCSHASRRSCTTDFSRLSRLIKQLHARHRVLLNFDMVNIIPPFAILMCQLFVSKRTSLATNVCASSQTGWFFTMTYMCHVMKPCQVSCFWGDILIY